MKSKTKNNLRIVISILYIIWGITSPILALKAILAFDIGGILSATVGVLMLLAGIFGLAKLNPKKCRAFGIVLFLLALVPIGLALPTINITAVVTAVLAGLFILCI